jgi:plastocyanin
LRGLRLATAAAAVGVIAGPASAFGAIGPTVYAGPNLQGPPPGVTTRQADGLFFYPRTVTVHVGDTVTWQFRGFHTVTFPGTKKPYPFVTPLKAKQPKTLDGSGQPFWWSGAAPVLAISPLSILEQGGTTISSPTEVRSSGLMRILTSTPKKPPAPFTLTFTKPGTYLYECAVHPGMRGAVRVLPSTAGVPSTATAEEAGVAALQRTITDVKHLQTTRPAAKLTVDVGIGRNATGAEIAAFFPGKLVIHAGDTVTFRNADQTDIHTVTFGPEKLRSQIENTFAAPHGRQVLFNPLGAFPSEPPGSGTPQYDATLHGHGYLNSGLLQPSGTPAKAGPQVFRVTFTKPGTYHYECVVHEHMDGTIVVR